MNQFQEFRQPGARASKSTLFLEKNDKFSPEPSNNQPHEEGDAIQNFASGDNLTKIAEPIKICSPAQISGKHLAKPFRKGVPFRLH
jgi:hypothetical protein